VSSKKTRSWWYRTASEFYEAAGEKAQATSLLREWLAQEEKSRDAAKSTTDRWASSWRIAGIQARLGEKALARMSIDRAGPAPEGMDFDPQVMYAEIPVLAPLEEWDRAAELLGKLDRWSWYNPCLAEDLAPMRREDRYANLFATCTAPASRKP
jgi:hypothetical protein